MMYFVKLTVLGLVLAATIGIAHSACGSGWTIFGSSCYHLGTDKLPWYGALVMCRVFGGSLAEINSASENTFVNQLKERQHVTSVWLGATDGLIDGDFRHVTDGSMLSYTNWDVGQPDNWQGKGFHRNKQNCVHMWGEGKWDDTHCTHITKYVCEKTA